MLLENEVDGEGFLLLTDEDISQIIQPLGTRRKLISMRNVLNSVVNGSSESDREYTKPSNSSACAYVGSNEVHEELHDECESK